MTEHSDRETLAFGVPDTPPGTLHALSISGSITVKPAEGRRIVFGRNWEEVHVCVGKYDQGVSRLQGTITRTKDQWWLSNSGQRPLRLPGSGMLFTDQKPIPLTHGYLPLFVRGSAEREHLLELYVSRGEPERKSTDPNALTNPPHVYRLSETERLVLVVLAQRYLLQEPHPQPIGRDQAAQHLNMLQPGAEWTDKKVDRTILQVRKRLSKEEGVSGLMRDEVGEPVGNTLNHNLIHTLINSTTLVPPDLRLIDVIDD